MVREMEVRTSLFKFNQPT